MLLGELVCVKEELSKSLKWITSPKIRTNIIFQGNNNKRGVGWEKIDYPYDPLTKNFSIVENLLCLHYGWEGHLKKTVAWKWTQESSSNCSKQRYKKKKGLVLSIIPKLKKIGSPHWTKNFLITLLSAYWKLRLKWVSKFNKLFIIQVRWGSITQCFLRNGKCLMHMTENT